MYIEGFIPNAILKQFRNVQMKRKQTTSVTTINNRMNVQSQLKQKHGPDRVTVGWLCETDGMRTSLQNIAVYFKTYPPQRNMSVSTEP